MKMGFERSKRNKQKWDCICEQCGIEFTICLMPKNWEYKIIFQNHEAWSSKESYQDLMIYCSERCLKKARGY